MTISRDTIEKIRASNGADTVPGTGTTVTEDDQGNEVVEKGDVPYGYSLVGAISQLERIAEEMDEYGLTLTDLSTEKQRDFDEAHEALQWHVALLTNEMNENIAGMDDGIELPNGKTVDLPKQAIAKGKSGDMPDPPGQA